MVTLTSAFSVVFEQVARNFKHPPVVTSTDNDSAE
jgi:hypothetical protein